MLVYLAFNNSACTSLSILHSPIDENRFYCILHIAISIDYNMSLITSQFQLREQMRSFKLSTIKPLTVNDNKHIRTIWELIYRNVNEQRNNGVITSS